MEEMIYEPELGLEGTLPELVDWCDRFSSDYSNAALERISELCKQREMDEKFVRIPLLVRDERKRENEAENCVGTPYERMKIDWYNFGKISYSESNYNNGETGTELEIWSEERDDDVIVVIVLSGVDSDGTWSAAAKVSIQEFMNGNYYWLDVIIGNMLLSKFYDDKQS